MTKDKDQLDVKQKVMTLKHEYLFSLNERLDEIRDAYKRFVQPGASNDKDRLMTLIRLLHNLNGSAGMYQLSQIQSCARELEHYLLTVFERGQTNLSSAEKNLVLNRLQQLKKNCEIAELDFQLTCNQETLLEKSLEDKAEKLFKAAYEMADFSGTKHAKKIMVIEDDVTQLNGLLDELTELGYQVHGLQDFKNIASELDTFQPDLLLVDIVLNNEINAGTHNVQMLQQQGKLDCPVVFLSVRDSIDARLGALRAGGSEYLIKPVDHVKLATTVKGLTRTETERKLRVLVADEDKNVTGFYETLLHSGGLQVLAENQIVHTLTRLYEYQPDLILLNLGMTADDGKGCSGIELAQLIRQINTFKHIPIVFLSDSSEEKPKLATIKAGADACLDKTTQPDKIIELVKLHALRGRELTELLYQFLHSETRLKNNQNRIKAIVDTVVDGIITINDKGIIYSFNPAAEKMFGYPADDVIGQNISILMPEQHKKHHDDHIANYVKTGHSYIIGHDHQREFEGLRKDGSVFPLELSVEKMHLDGQLLFTGVMRDISERKKFEEKLIEAAESAQQANRAKSVFVSSMSHELRTPLNAIIGLSKLFEYDDNLTGIQVQNVEQIAKSGEHLLALINDILDLAKIEAGKIDVHVEGILINELLQDCLSLMNTCAETYGIEIKFLPKYDDEHCVYGDYTRLKQVILNLLSNAIKYNRPNGSVTICTGYESEKTLTIFIEDTGIGIAQEDQAKVFEPFNRLGADATQIEGTGIGMVITKQLIELMGGHIGLESTPNKGTTFWVTLNMCSLDDFAKAEDQATIKKSEQVIISSNSSPMAFNLKVLVAEDNPVNQMLMEQLLTRLGCAVDMVKDGVEALEKLESNQYDLLLTDIEMPKMDGFQLVAAIRQHHSTVIKIIPVIAVTANASSADTQRCLESGMDDYISKPIVFSELERALKKWQPSQAPVIN